MNSAKAIFSILKPVLRASVFFVIFWINRPLHGQSPIFSKTAQAYSRISGGTQVMKDSVWDDPEQWKPADRNIPLGFNFQAFGKTIQTFLWEQGAVIYRQGDTVIKIGLEADLCDYGFGTKNARSPLYWKKEGTAGNYIVKLEWQSFGFWDEWADGNVCIDSANLQLWIYENPQKIELRFGPRKIQNFNKWFPDKLGVTCAKYDGVGNTSGIVLDGDPINPSTFSFADTGTRGLTSWPVANQVYIFSFSQTDKVEQLEPNTRCWYADHKIYSTVENMPFAIYNPEGRLVLNSSVNQGYADVSLLKPGIYIAITGSVSSQNRLKFLVTD